MLLLGVSAMISSTDMRENISSLFRVNVVAEARAVEAIMDGECRVTTNCYGFDGEITGNVRGTVECSGTNGTCRRGRFWVECDGIRTECGNNL